MGWFWADAPPPSTPSVASCPVSRPPAGRGSRASESSESKCPMHKKTIDAFNPAARNKAPNGVRPPSGCPVSHDKAQEPRTRQSVLSRLNPLNYMFNDLSNAPAPNQTMALPTEREASTIPKGSGDGNWEYPSPQQMYHALLRKGYTDTDPTAVEPMVAIHNFLNEGAWAEIVDWERRFGKGLARGWQISREGEQRAPAVLRRLESMEAMERRTVPGAADADAEDAEPSLIRFQGRPKDMTPKAAFFQLLGWAYPAKFGTEPPFDRHDWYVRRSFNGREKEVRYVIDYYSGPPEPTGEPVFYLDVRPAMTPTAAVERLMRWGGDVWWRASGAEVREASR